jgi:hypothetical protein
MNRLRGMPAGGFVVCGFVVYGFIVCDFVVCGTGGACDVEMGEKEERTGAQKNRLPSRAACSFLSSEFSSAGIFRVPRRWLSAGDGSALFGNERICTVLALVRGGTALAAEPGIKALQPVPGRGGREKFPCRVFRFGGRAVKYRFSRCECKVFAAVLAAGQILHPEVKRRIAAAFA